MASPHNVSRYGEVWDKEKISVCLSELEKLQDLVVLSGGWAWHFMSPRGHEELKHAHDHKDIDLFVKPNDVVTLLQRLMSNGFVKVKTRYDKLPSPEEFRRYEKTVFLENDKSMRVTIDLFVNEVPFIVVDGWKVVEPKHLLSLYLSIHSSKSCFAVVAAEKLVNRGESLVGRKELTEVPLTQARSSAGKSATSTR